MNKEAFYFTHDYESTNDPKIQALLGEFGALGYGIYWRVVEMLHSDSSHKLPFKKYLFLAIAKQMLTSVEQTEAIINQCINVFELFSSDDDFFWSNRVLRNFELRAQLSEKRAIAGRAGAIAKQVQANPSKGKERKGKEKRNKKNIKKKFISPSLQEFKQYFLEKGYREDVAVRAWTGYNEANWFDSKGNPVLNWKQKVNNVWFKDDNKIPTRKDSGMVY